MVVAPLETTAVTGSGRARDGNDIEVEERASEIVARCPTATTEDLSEAVDLAHYECSLDPCQKLGTFPVGLGLHRVKNDVVSEEEAHGPDVRRASYPYDDIKLNATRNNSLPVTRTRCEQTMAVSTSSVHLEAP